MSGRGCLVGLDVGTSAVKGIAIDPEGTVLALAEVALPTLDAPPGMGGAGPGGLVGGE